ncbi:hypothetical protein [Microcoleus sp. FACHB-68]|uniref:hypothetical protein n=1 Tax=Microcoleus sp. FACHB-68 TaxID=2692826 RepID=UPI0016872EC7|nr:hypothetical protein [Microcoleus sp. FACHB-68]MBD1938728.1 hypothetical protein [Microcoleus sp. FACHB-68]
MLVKFLDFPTGIKKGRRFRINRLVRESLTGWVILSDAGVIKRQSLTFWESTRFSWLYVL